VVGRAVARAMLDEARAIGLREITATAVDTWPSGTAFLTALGFRVGDVSQTPMNRNVLPGEPVGRRATFTF
jgi:N-acetylglutamate synthase-like GNAT family acetyltransferase